MARLRDVVEAPDGTLLVLTNNTDGRGEPGPADDRLLRFTP
ncbi:PQQ-dependent sugar dehydrogenase [Brevibacterium pigmentatum]|nr:PQQ-dependent sugar dehydrogenase [Brevibacterium pigmentatum]